jgi:hypothetical protein
LGRKRISLRGGFLVAERGVFVLPVERFVSTNQNFKIELHLLELSEIGKWYSFLAQAFYLHQHTGLLTGNRLPHQKGGETPQ